MYLCVIKVSRPLDREEMHRHMLTVMCYVLMCYYGQQAIGQGRYASTHVDGNVLCTYVLLRSAGHWTGKRCIDTC